MDILTRGAVAFKGRFMGCQSYSDMGYAIDCQHINGVHVGQLT